MSRIYNTAVTNIPLISPTCNKIKNAKKGPITHYFINLACVCEQKCYKISEIRIVMKEH